MEGRVLWYKPGSRRGCLTSDAGRQFAFETEGEDRSIRGGARVTFKVSELDGDLVGVNVHVIQPLTRGKRFAFEPQARGEAAPRVKGQSCLEALNHEDEDLGRGLLEVMASRAESQAPGHESAFAGHSPG